MGDTVYDPPVEFRVLVETVAARLEELQGLAVYVEEVPEDDDLPVDRDGRVEPYAVVWPNLPAPADDGDLADTYDDRSWSVQVTVVAGWALTVLDRAEQVHQHLHRWAPSYDTQDGTVVCSRFQTPPGYEPAVLPDGDVTPIRHFVPLQYRTTATTPIRREPTP